MYSLFNSSTGKIISNHNTLSAAEAAWEKEAARLLRKENTGRDWINGHLLVVQTKGAPVVTRAWNGPVPYEVMGAEIV